MATESGTEDAARSIVEPGTTSAERSWLIQRGLSGWDATALLAAGLAIVLFAPPLFLESWSPRMALILAIGPLGLLALAHSAWSGDVPSRLLAAALVWTVFVSAVSPGPRSALLGFAGRDLSALTVSASAGFWSLGRLVGDRARHLMCDVVAWAAAASASVGIAQVVADVGSGPLALASGRPTGLAANAVYFGAISATGLMVCVSAWSASSWRRVVVPLVLSGAAVSLSGSRVALLAVVVAVTAHTAVRRDRSSLLGAGAGIAALASGVVLDRVAGAGRNAAGRLTDGSGGGRQTVWRYGLEAFTDRPLLGHGFGRFRPAVQDKFSVEFVRDNSIDDLTQAWFDAHNVGIGVLVAVGIVGTVLFIAWAMSWTPSIRGPLAWALVPLVLHWLLQPVSLFTLPLAMLLFGAAGAIRSIATPPRYRTTAAAALVGVVLAATLLLGDLAFQRAVDELDADSMATIAFAAGNDPVLGDVVAQAYELETPAADSNLNELDWRRRVADSESDRPFWWSRLAEEQLEAGLVDEAEVSLRRALELQANNARSVRIETLLALRAEDETRLQAALDLLCALGRSDCTIDAEELIEEYRSSTSP